jgi:hypothetical protein
MLASNDSRGSAKAEDSVLYEIQMRNIGIAETAAQRASRSTSEGYARKALQM